MSIWLLGKAVLLMAAIVCVVPLMFVLFLRLLGHRFSLAIASDSWVARSNSRVIRALFGRYLT